MTSGRSGPLDGVRVIDLTINVLGPVGTQILGDMGAEVIKVEAPGGDPMRWIGPSRSGELGPFFQTTNRNKRSIVLDLKQQTAHAALCELVSGADVFVHNMRHAAAGRLGIGYADISAVNPAIVYASATGYHADGPYRDRPAYDDVIQGECGLVGLIGRTGGEPGFVPMPIADKFCGYVLASSIAMALVHRERTGEGQEVHVPMLETMLSLTMTTHLWQGVADGPPGYPRAVSPWRRPFRTRDGMICLLAHTDAQWDRLLRAVDRPDLAEDPRFARMAQRAANIVELQQLLAAALAERTTEEVRRRLEEVDVPVGPVNDLEGILEDAYLEETGFFRTIDHPREGTVRTTAIPVSFSATPGTIRHGAPMLGADTADVLRRAGVPEATVAELSPGDGG